MTAPPALARAHQYGVTVIADRENLRLVTSHKPPDEILAALRGDKGAIRDYLRAAADPPTDTTHPLIIAEHWRQRFFASINAEPAPCPGFGRNEWPRVYAAITDFLNPAAALARLAAECHWTALKLFGVHRTTGASRVDACDALLVGNGAKVTHITAATLWFANGLNTPRLALDPTISVPVWNYEQEQQ
jgi:hypothetical protein